MSIIIATWKFGAEACETGWAILAAGGSALDAVEAGAVAVEENPEVLSVGYGGLPNAEGVVELDAVIMDGRSHAAGAVCALSRIRRPVSVARRVMQNTPHVLLAGHNARRFALREGFPDSDLTTEESRRRFRAWRLSRTAPDVAHFEPAPERSGEYRPLGHDTVGVCALDSSGNLAAACTTSGLAWKVPGRVGDSPLVGSGLYVDNEVGAAAATGNGDEIMKVCLSYRAVMQMELGSPPQEACEEAIRYLLRKRPDHQMGGASLIALSKGGQIGQCATTSGFQDPDRRWFYASMDGAGMQVREGTYTDGG